MAKACQTIRVYDRKKRIRRSRPTCIDIFAGAGGLAEGFRQAGWAIVSAVDAAPASCETFRKNFPEATVFECTVGALDGHELLEDAGLRPGELDCLIGGPPCQSFSYNNHERSASGHRARLFRDYLRLVETMLPKYIVMENVPGILTIGDGRVVEEIVESLSELGYECEPRILFAEEFGVPQQRRRVFFVGSRVGWDDRLFPRATHGPVAKPAPSEDSIVSRRSAPKSQLKALVSVWDAISDLPKLENGEEFARKVNRRMARTAYQRLMRGKADSALTSHKARSLSARLMARVRTVPEGGNWRDIPRRLLPAGMKRARLSDHTRRYGRPARKSLSCTILTKADPHWGAYIHPVDDRAFTVREVARLQSFPDTFAFAGPLLAQFKQVGNAVPPLLARALGRSIARHWRQVIRSKAVSKRGSRLRLERPVRGTAKASTQIAA